MRIVTQEDQKNWITSIRKQLEKKYDLFQVMQDMIDKGFISDNSKPGMCIPTTDIGLYYNDVRGFYHATADDFMYLIPSIDVYPIYSHEDYLDDLKNREREDRFKKLLD